MFSPPGNGIETEISNEDLKIINQQLDTLVKLLTECDPKGLEYRTIQSELNGIIWTIDLLGAIDDRQLRMLRKIR